MRYFAPKTLIQALLDNEEIVKIYVFPGLLFFFDFAFRAILHIDLIDAGADMALISASTFVALILDSKDEKANTGYLGMIFLLPFLIFWFLCLSIIARPDPIIFQPLEQLDFRLVFSWLIGIFAFYFSGVYAREIIGV